MASPQGKPLCRWITENPFLIAGAIYLPVNGILLLIARAANSEWDQVFVYSASLLVHGGDIYAPGINQFQLNHPFTYPPFTAVLGIPFVFLPHLLSRLGWFVVQAVALTTLWILSWRISGGKALNRGRGHAIEGMICVLGLIAGMRYIQGAFGHQQSDILIDALLAAGCYAWQHRRDFLAASAWAFAAAFKGPPLIMAIYLAWRGRWVAAAWMIILTVALNLVPDVIHHAPQGIWLAQWYTRIVKPTNSQIGAWYVDVTINQSIAGAAHRFFTTGWYLANHQLNLVYNRKIVSDQALKLMVYALDAALLLAAAVAMRQPFKRAPDSKTAGLECALMFILMLLLSPMSHKTHFGILILPGFFVARDAIVNRNRVSAWCMLICVIVIGLLDHFFLYSPLGDLFAWFGNVTIGAAALGAACLFALARESKIEPPTGGVMVSP
jgi:Glycosyltransferase family 87